MSSVSDDVCVLFLVFVILSVFEGFRDLNRARDELPGVVLRFRWSLGFGFFWVLRIVDRKRLFRGGGELGFRENRTICAAVMRGCESFSLSVLDCCLVSE